MPENGRDTASELVQGWNTRWGAALVVIFLSNTNLD
jgi:hypothetical protein